LVEIKNKFNIKKHSHRDCTGAKLVDYHACLTANLISVFFCDLNQLFSSYGSSCSRNQKCIAMALFHILIKPILLLLSFNKCSVFTFAVSWSIIFVVVVVITQQ